MLKSLKIENFRGFQSFELQQLGRINLLVGKNNSGKTSVLEAIQLFYSPSNFESLRQAMTNRGEFIWNEERASSVSNRELDIRHLFYNHEIDLGSKFLISGTNNNFQDTLVASITAHEPINEEQVKLFDFDDDELRELSLTIDLQHGGEPEGFRFLLSPNGGLSIDYARRIRRSIKNSAIRTLFITSSSLTISEMIDLFDQVVLKPEEQTIVHALKTIDPVIDRIASVGSDRYRSGVRGGFVVRRTGSEQRVPIGSMGDGIWRMLGLSLAVVCTKGGVLLVDEIDTGLHFTTMTNMWRMLWETAKQSNVQVGSMSPL